jgi:hypothetical protein
MGYRIVVVLGIGIQVVELQQEPLFTSQIDNWHRKFPSFTEKLNRFNGFAVNGIDIAGRLTIGTIKKNSRATKLNQAIERMKTNMLLSIFIDFMPEPYCNVLNKC